MYKIIVLISGNGSNLQAIIDTINQQQWPIEIAAVVSDQAQAYGLERAKKANIPTEVFTKINYPIRADYDQQLQQLIDTYQPDLVVLAGFMRILTPGFVAHYEGRLINIHPSLLPDYKGLNTHQRVIENNEKYHGVSVHFVTKELDGGPVIAQMKLTIHNEDTPESLQQRIHQLEHRLYPTVIHWLAEQRLKLTKNGIKFDNKFVGAYGIEISQLNNLL